MDRASQTDSDEPALLIQEFTAGYGGAPVISDVALQVNPGSVACLIGPNGAGKSTVIRAITKEAVLLKGRAFMRGLEITSVAAELLPGRGLGWVPQHDDVFVTLTARENLEMGGYLLPPRAVASRIQEVYDLFPLLGTLRSRPAGKLSGGERKVLALGRAMMIKPSVLLLDEPTASLSPEMAKVVLEEYVRAPSAEGVAVLLVEQRAEQALAVSDWAYVMVAGRVSLSAPAIDVAGRSDIGELFLGLKEVD